MDYAPFGPEARDNAATLITLAMAEDFGTLGDLTSRATIRSGAGDETVRFVAREAGVLAGLPVLVMLCERFGIGTGLTVHHDGGSRLDPGTVLATVEGQMRTILAMERISLNFLQRLSGIATLTARYVDEVRGTRASILDTRKTTPGWRALEKYAVRCGGGQNHRMGLYDAILIKDNHLAHLDSLLCVPGRSVFGRESKDPVSLAIELSRAEAPQGTTVTVEVDTLDQLDRALECGPDIILVDNFGPDGLREAVRRRDARAPGVLLEASGGVNLKTVRELAETGVDRISVGALTHSAPSLDIGLDYGPASEAAAGG